MLAVSDYITRSFYSNHLGQNILTVNSGTHRNVENTEDQYHHQQKEMKIIFMNLMESIKCCWHL